MNSLSWMIRMSGRERATIQSHDMERMVIGRMRRAAWMCRESVAVRDRRVVGARSDEFKKTHCDVGCGCAVAALPAAGRHARVLTQRAAATAAAVLACEGK